MKITEDVEIPDNLIQSLRNRKVVIFVGAGASIAQPANFPTFQGLASQLADMADVNPPKDNQNLDAFVGSLPSDFDLQKQTRNLFNATGHKPNKLHKAIVHLSNAGNNGTGLRIVTTNYDTLLERAAAEENITFTEYDAPALPLGDKFTGIVHLHGCSTQHAGQLVITGSDFAQAYMTRAWATRFLLDMFARYVVVFVGYSHDDLMMRYLALGLRDNTTRYVFISENQAKNEHDKWKQLGIQPITYPVHNHNHDALTTALEELSYLIANKRSNNEHRIAEIMAAGQDRTHEQDDYLKQQVHTLIGIRCFIKNAGVDRSWLEWLLQMDEFKSLFGPREPNANQPYEKEALEWFYNAFAADPKQQDFVLSLIEAQPLSTSLFTGLNYSAGILLHQKHNVEADNLLATLWCDTAQQSLPEWDDDILYSYANVPLPLPVLRNALDYYLLRSPSLSSLCAINDQLKTCITSDSMSNDELLTVLESSLLHACQIQKTTNQPFLLYVRAANSCMEHSAYESEGNVKEISPAAPVVKAMCKLGELLPNQLELSDHWWKLGYRLFKRMAIWLVNVNTHILPDVKMRWMLERCSLRDVDARSSIRELIRSTISGTSQDTKELFLQWIIAPPDRVEDDTKTINELRINYLEEALFAITNWTEARQLKDALSSGCSDKKPKSTESKENQTNNLQLTKSPSFSTQSIENLINTNPSALARAMSSMPRLSDPGPHLANNYMEDVCSILGQTCAKHPETGLAIWGYFKRLNGRNSQPLLKSILKGWGSADIRSCFTQIADLIKPLCSDQDYADSLSLFIYLQTDSRPQYLTTEQLGTITNYIDAIWKHNCRKYRLHTTQCQDGPLNEWPGRLALAVCNIFIKQPDNRLRAEAKSLIAKFARTTTDTLKSTVPALAWEIQQLHSVDPDLCRKIIYPLFRKQETAESAWTAFIYGGNIDKWMVQDGFAKILLEGLNDWIKPATPANDHLDYLIIGTLSHIDSAEEESEALMRATVRKTDSCQFSRSLRLLFSQQETNREYLTKLWSTWIGSYFKMRFAGLPSEASRTELRNLAFLPFFIEDTSTANAAAIILDNNPGIDSDNLVRLIRRPGARKIRWSKIKVDLLSDLIRKTNLSTLNVYMHSSLVEFISGLSKQPYKNSVKRLEEIAFEQGLNYNNALP